MVSIKSSFVASQISLQAPSYHAVISKHLQKQFLHSCICTLIVCYIGSFALGNHHNFGALFPWSWTGPRSLALFLAILPINLVRKANLEGWPLKEDSRDALTPTSGKSQQKLWATFRLSEIHQSACTSDTSRLCLFQSIHHDDISQKSVRQTSLVSTNHSSVCCPHGYYELMLILSSYELPRVNERWILVHFFSVYIAFVSSFVHIWTEVDVLCVQPSAEEVSPHLAIDGNR